MSTRFSVWAGVATSVHVVGTFNRWNQNAHPMHHLSNGIWQLTIPNARPGDLYKYVINGNHWKRDPRSRRVVHAGNSDSIIYDPSAYIWSVTNFIPPRLEELVIYELHAGTFNDTHPGSPGSASLDDARARLDHIASLGANAVLLMPVTEFPGAHSWGYNPTDPFAVDNLTYGGPDALKRFVDAAHQRGIAVLLDVVHNHYGTSELPGDLDHSLWNFDGSSTNGGMYFYQDPVYAMTRWGPRPDYSRPEIRRYITDNIRMWLEEYRIDGLRWDATKFMRLADDETTPIAEGISLIREINDLLHREFTNKLSIAEDLAQLEETTMPVHQGGLGFHSDWHAEFHHALTEELARGPALDAGRITRALSYSHHTRRTIYAESHDEAGHPDKGQVRVPVTMNPVDPEGYLARKKTLLIHGLLMTTPGIPMLLQGQEILTTQSFHDVHSIDWSRAERYPGILAFFRDAIHLRRNFGNSSSALLNGNVSVTSQTIPGAGTILQIYRPGVMLPDDDLLVVANLTGEHFIELPLIWPSDGRWHSILNSDHRTYSPDFGDHGTSFCDVDASRVRNIAIAPWSLIVFSRSAPGPSFETISIARKDGDLEILQPLTRSGRDLWTTDLTVTGALTLAFRFVDGTNQSNSWGAGAIDSHGAVITGSARLGDARYFEISDLQQGVYRFSLNTASGAVSIRAITSPIVATTHERAAVAGNFNGYDPSANMMANSNGLWEGEYIIRQDQDLRFKFAAYETMQASWGVNGIIHTGTPAQGRAVGGISDDIQINGPLYGRYRFTFDDAHLHYTVERIGPPKNFGRMAIAGNFNQWDTTPNMVQLRPHVWQFTSVISQAGSVEFKFTADPFWEDNWGRDNSVAASASPVRFAHPDAANIILPGPVDGVFTITFDSDTLQYSIERSPNPPDALWNAMAIAGDFNGWSFEPTMRLDDANEWTTDRLFRNAGEIRFKFVAENSWSSSWGDDTSPSLFPARGIAGGSRDIVGMIQEPGVYRITFNDRNLTYRFERIERAFSLAGIQRDHAGNPSHLAWPSVAGAEYAIHASTNLASAFSVIADGLPATPPENSFMTQFEDGGTRFFRVIEK